MSRSRNNLQQVQLRTFLKDKRVFKNISQLSLAEKLNLPQSFVSKYESGERFLTFIDVIHISEVLDIEIQDIFNHITKDCYEAR